MATEVKVAMVEVEINEHQVKITLCDGVMNEKSVREIVQHVKDIEAGVK